MQKGPTHCGQHHSRGKWSWVCMAKQELVRKPKKPKECSSVVSASSSYLSPCPDFPQ